MKISSLTFVAGIAIHLIGPAIADGNAQQQKWRQELGSQDYQTRVKAMEEVWQTGEGALAFLEELTKGEDPELVTRAAAIAQKIKLGITPDTPEKVVDLINSYLKATPTGRIAAIEKLRDIGAFDYILKLRRSETEQRVVERMDGMIKDLMPSVVRAFLNEEKFTEAKEVLGLSNQFKHMIQLGDLLKTRGELDQEIAKLADTSSPGETARYLAYLRVKGDPALLRKEAKRLGERFTEVQAALVEGDHVPYFEYLLGEGGPRPGGPGLGLATQHYLKWTLANHRGDLAAQQKALEALEYIARQASEEQEARVSLFRMGYGDRVIESLGEEGLETRIGYHLMQENYAKARDLIGLPPSGPLDDWLAETLAKAEKELKTSERGNEFGRLIAAVEFLEARGLTDDATRCALEIFEMARGKIELNLAILGREMFFSAPAAVLKAAAREIDEHEATPSFFISQLSGNNDSHLWLFRLLKEIDPKMETEEVLRHTFSFSSRHLLVPVESYEMVSAKVFERVLDSDKPSDGLKNLFQVLRYRNREAELRKVTEALAETGAENEYLRGLLAIDSGRLEDAVVLFEKLGVEFSKASATFLHQHGLLLKKAGKEGSEEFLKQAELLSDGSSAVLASFAEQHLRFGETERSHELLREALLRSPVLPVPDDYSSVSAILEGLSAGAAELGKWQEALAYREVVALTSSFGGESGGVYYMRDRFQVLVARAAVAMKNDDVEKAVASFSEAHRILPRDGYLANELFPVMRELGLSERHDQLFAESARYAKEAIRMFPKDDNAYNNFAWMASRANRQLDEAEDYLKKALALKPQSAAYLDTMAEIHFARRNRPEAIKWSNLSLQNEVFGSASSRWELHQQNRRFKSGDFPVR